MDPVSSSDVLRDLWLAAGLPHAALADAELPDGAAPLPSSFAVGVAAQSSIAAAALAAASIWSARTGRRQKVRVGVREAAFECTGHFSIDGRVPDAWDPLSGLYPCGEDRGEPGYVRIHANFAHHREGALTLLGLCADPAIGKPEITRALRAWRSSDLEQAAADTGCVIAALRSFDEWDAHPQSAALRGEPLVAIERIGDAPAHAFPPLRTILQPLAGLRVLDLTRILAGPVAGRTLAAHGADVMLVNAPHLPNIESIVDTSRGKLSVYVDLAGTAGRTTLEQLVRQAHVFIQGYRPGSLAARGFAPSDLARLRPGIVCVSLSAYGFGGPWAGRRGFDSLVQTATGFNHAEGVAAGGAAPRALPMQILDYASGFLMAFGAQAALLRQAREGGSWQVRVSLARTADWLRGMGRVPDGLAVQRGRGADLLREYASGYGKLVAFAHAAVMSETPPRWHRPSMPPGSHPPAWPS